MKLESFLKSSKASHKLDLALALVINSLKEVLAVETMLG